MEDWTKAREQPADADGRRRGGARPRPGAGHGPPRRSARTVARRRRPAPKGAPRGGVARALGLAATVLLLGVGVTAVTMVTRGGEKSTRKSVAGTPTATATAAARARARRTRPPRLTNAQRASRDAAVAQLRRQGFEPVAISAYRPRQALRVLIGRPKASTTVRGRRAFFFLREQYIGTDAVTPSARLTVAQQGDGQITLAYTRFAAGDKPCCPSDGKVKVRFAMSDGRLQPLDAIPPAAARMPPA
jgi:hypothetical protein